MILYVDNLTFILIYDHFSKITNRLQATSNSILKEISILNLMVTVCLVHSPYIMCLSFWVELIAHRPHRITSKNMGRRKHISLTHEYILISPKKFKYERKA